MGVAGEENWKSLMGFKEGEDKTILHRVGRGSKEINYRVLLH